MFNSYFEFLCGTTLPYRFRFGLVNFESDNGDRGGPGGDKGGGGVGDGDHGLGSSSSSGDSSGDDGKSSGSGSGGMSPDARADSYRVGPDGIGMTVTGYRGSDDPSRKGIDGIGGGSGNYNSNTFGQLMTSAAVKAPAKITAKAKDIAQNLLGKVVDGLTLTNPVTGLANIGTKMYSGKTLGDHAAQAVANALASGLSQEAAEAVGAAAVAAAVANDPSVKEGGFEGTDDIIFDAFTDHFIAARIDPNTGQSTAPKEGTWDHYVEQFFGTPEGIESAQALLKEHADYAKSQFDAWQASRDESVRDYGIAVNKQGGLLDDLIDQSREGTGLFSPVKFKLAGQEIAFTPRANRAQADQMAGFGKADLTNRVGLHGARSATADDTYQFSLPHSPVNADLAYLDQLKELAGKTEGIGIARDTLTQQGNIADADRKAREPGLLDYIKGAETLFGMLD